MRSVGIRPTLLLLLLAATLQCIDALTLDALSLRSSTLSSSRCSLLMGAKKAPAKKKKKAPSSGGGFGAKTAAPAGPTAAELLKKSMALYEELERQSGKSNAAEAEDLKKDAEESAAEESAADEEPSETLTKYAVAVRADGSKEFSDWVPVAILALQCGSEFQPAPFVAGALGSSVKVVLEAGGQSVSALKKLDRASIEYAYENLDSFQTHVYDGLFGRSERRAKAAETLGVAPDASAGDVKRAHRKLMMELHPDRFVGDEEGAAQAQQQMLEVQEAYGEMGGGTGGGSGSWYASVGGKARVDFSGPLEKAVLGPLGKERTGQAMALESGGWRAAVFPFEPTLSQEFVTRNIARSLEN